MFSPFVWAISLETTEFLYIKGEYLVSLTVKSSKELFLSDLICFLFCFLFDITESTQ